jgi:branched-chain amino acid transport system ATP-binding protein
MSVLDVDDLTVGYRAGAAVRSVTLHVEAGELLTVLGPNGAGKTTLLKTIAGLLVPWEGTVAVDGRDVTRSLTEERARAGLLLVPEGRRLFRGLTTVENLRAGAFTGRDGMSIDDVLTLFPRLAERRTSHAGLLSGGEQQMLAIGRALRAGPRALLIDEPSLGLAPMIVDLVFAAFRELSARGIAIVLAEQNVHAATAVADRCVILDTGEMRFSGPCVTEADREQIRHAYSETIALGASA